MRPRLCVFDCDGTIVDSQDSIVRAMSAAFQACALEPPAARDIRRVVGLPLATAALSLAPAGTDPAMAEDLADAYRTAFRGLRRDGTVDDPLFPGVREAVDELNRDGWLLGIATGKGRRGLAQTLERHGLSDRFITLQTADDGPGKPDPGMLIRAMAQTGAESADTVMIGDTTYDVEMSRRAGVLAIGVAWGYHEPEELMTAGASRVIAGFDDLTPSLLELMEAET